MPQFRDSQSFLSASLVCLLWVVLTAVPAPASAAAEPSVSDSARLEAIKAHVIDLVITIPDAQFAFESAGPRLPVEDSTYMQALSEAAYYYALRTGDFAVSVNDLLEQGFWPYDTFTEEERNCYLYDLPTMPGEIFCRTNQTFDEYLAECATDVWLFRTRADILDTFYRDYFEYQQYEVGEINIDLPEPAANFFDVAVLIGATGQPVGEIEDVSITRFLDRNTYYSDGRARQEELEAQYGHLTVPYLSVDYSLLTNSTTSGYDSQYREQTRLRSVPEEGDVPPAQPAPDAAAPPASPGAVVQ